MLRWLLWAVMAFIVWKLFRLGTSFAQRPKEKQEEIPFPNIEEADFEDISKEPPEPPEPKQDP